MRELVYDIAGGVPDGRQLKCVIPGGSSVPALTPDQLDTPLDYDSIQAAGSFFGAASLIVVDDRCCMVQLALRASKFYMHESCGKCTPCREGTRWMVQLLEKIEAGDASHADIDLLESVGTGILGRSLCALGDFAVYPVAELPPASPTSSAPTSTAEAASATPPPSRGSSPPRTCTPRIASRSRCMHDLVRLTVDDREVEVPAARVSSRRRRRQASRSRCSATSPGWARRWAPAACASSRSKELASHRQAAH